VEAALREGFADRRAGTSRLKRWLLRSASEEQRRDVDRFFEAALAAAEGKLAAPEPLRLALFLYTPFDLFHTNTLEILSRAAPGLWKRGDLLVAMRNLDLVAVLDDATAEVKWAWGAGVLDMPHQPSLLANGDILVLDNGTRRRRSRLVEVNPNTRRVVWTYEGNARSPFFTAFGGGCEELPNGDILVTETHRGRAFEITRRGELVWEYLHPSVKLGERMRIYRLTRVAPEAGARLRGQVP
jgi:hypothetical protein